MTGPRDWVPEEPAAWARAGDPAWQRYANAQSGSGTQNPWSAHPARPARPRRGLLLALTSLATGVFAIWIAVTPLVDGARTSQHGFALSTIGVTAILLGFSAVRRHRAWPNAGVLALSVSGIGAGVIGTVAMLGVLATSQAPAGSSALVQAPDLGQAPSLTHVTFSQVAVEGAARTDGVVVGNGGSVRLDAGYAVRSNPTVAVRLERRLSGGEWTPTGVTVPVIEGAPLSARTPVYSTSKATESVQYRFASDASVSAPASVRYENQTFYRGMAATIYGYAAEYCPTTAVHVASLGGTEAGQYGTGSRLILVDSRVGVSVNTTLESQRSLAIHECSHELQWINYGATQQGREQMTAAASTLFAEGNNGAPALEHAADCGAMAVVPDGYLGYGGFCTPDELSAAARLLHGQRY